MRTDNVERGNNPVFADFLIHVCSNAKPKHF